MTLTLISQCASYDPTRDLALVPAIDGDDLYEIAVSGTTLMDRAAISGLAGPAILDLVLQYRGDLTETAEILRRNGQVSAANRIDILALESDS